jgi:hypothetical protein
MAEDLSGNNGKVFSDLSGCDRNILHASSRGRLFAPAVYSSRSLETSCLSTLCLL